jgi:osmoprotectant transport system substrate-binding protein
MKRLIACGGLLGLIVALIAVGCGGASGSPSGSNANKGPITVGSKSDTEGSLLAEVIILILRNKGFQVNDKSQFGETSIVRKAIISGEIDMYPEYTGNGAFFFNEADSPVWKDAQKGYERVKALDKQANNIDWLTPAPANNTWAIAVTKNLATQEKLVSLADFATFVNKGGKVKLIGSEEFVTSAAALPAFEQAYGFNLRQDQLVTIQSGNTAQTEKAASDGTDGVNAAMAYGTDGGLSAFGLVVLSDPKGVQPVYEPTPIIRGQVLDKYPEISGDLAPVFETLDLVTLQTLNGRIAVNGENPTDVARAYLKQRGFLK